MRRTLTCLLAAVFLLGSLGCASETKVQTLPTPTSGASAQAVAPTATSSAPTATKAPAPTPTPKQPDYGTVGQKMTSAGIGLSVLSAKRTSESGNQFIKPKQGNEYIVIEVVVENEGREKTPYNLMYFKAKDSDGFEYNTALVPVDNLLKSGELAQGEKVRGTVWFEVPTTAKGLIVTYQPMVILGGYQPIKFKLD